MVPLDEVEEEDQRNMTTEEYKVRDTSLEKETHH
jgi:hypothetical protein